jgi:hypothetical protein
MPTYLGMAHYEAAVHNKTELILGTSQNMHNHYSKRFTADTYLSCPPTLLVFAVSADATATAAVPVGV